MLNSKPIIIIPAYKPDQSLVDLVSELTQQEFLIIIVNDGSGSSFDAIFQACHHSNVTILEHAVNLGKGQALKTAFNYFLNSTHHHSPGVVTADADGQHRVKDIVNVSEFLANNPFSLCLGVRSFSKGVPFRSRFGNTLTRFIFKLLIGHSLTDTQTGLRGIPRSFLKPLLKSNSSGYDFELDMLISAAKQKIKMKEVPIETVYKDNNKSSHFNPLVDSFKIYFVFFRFLVFAIVSGLLDFLAFSFAYLLFGQVFISETLARIFSGTCNFLLNKELVFKSKERLLPEALKYAALCLVNLVFSYGLISSLVYLGANVFASKLIALTGLFVANFAIQKVLVFRKEEASFS